MIDWQYWIPNIHVEWYALLPSKVGSDTWTTIEQRIARLSHRLKDANRLKTLHTLANIGFVDHSGVHHFEFVLIVPSWFSNSIDS